MATPNPIDLQKALKGADYPAAREDLISPAKDNGADDTLVEKISHVTTDRFDWTGPRAKGCFGNE